MDTVLAASGTYSDSGGVNCCAASHPEWCGGEQEQEAEMFGTRARQRRKKYLLQKLAPLVDSHELAITIVYLLHYINDDEIREAVGAVVGMDKEA